MKQIFDWMHEHLEETAQDVSPNTDKLVVLARVERLLNEAEAKWEAEVCEYKPRKAWKIGYCYKTGCGNERTSTVYSNVKYCEYCGKPIKISEVE